MKIGPSPGSDSSPQHRTAACRVGFNLEFVLVGAVAAPGEGKGIARLHYSIAGRLGKYWP
jgi:hypothetical protein